VRQTYDAYAGTKIHRYKLIASNEYASASRRKWKHQGFLFRINTWMKDQDGGGGWVKLKYMKDNVHILVCQNAFFPIPSWWWSSADNIESWTWYWVDTDTSPEGGVSSEVPLKYVRTNKKNKAGTRWTRVYWNWCPDVPGWPDPWLVKKTPKF